MPALFWAQSPTQKAWRESLNLSLHLPNQEEDPQWMKLINIIMIFYFEFFVHIRVI